MTGMQTVILMAKAPIAGTVKTRLCPPLSQGEAARLYERLLLDAAGCLRAVPSASLVASFAPAAAAPYFRGAAFEGFRASAQRGADLGERMTNAIGEAFAGGAKRVAIVGADCPGLSPGRVALAFDELRRGADAVFGPTPDGGFYLAGFNAFPGGLFGPGIPWSTGSVMADVLGRCRKSGMAWSLLPEERDIDTPEDLAWLTSASAFRGRPAAARRTSR
ncbi:MAG TPA: TIGR04282 family arsenosugar biosynthesis glycosyltransferase [Candidatus Deferrimicrobiaceae bacterium]